MPALRRRQAQLDALLRAELERGSAAGSAAAILIAARLPEEELLAELRALLIVGEETTACALAWGVELLAHHPQQAWTLAEQDGVYAEALAHEVLRLRPRSSTRSGLHTPRCRSPASTSRQTRC